MEIEVEKKNNENVSRLLRRFNNAIQRSQLLTTAKEKQEYEKPPTDREQKESALRRKKIEEERNEY